MLLWKKLKPSNVVLPFIVNRSTLVCALLRNNPLFVGQLYEDKSLAIRSSMCSCKLSEVRDLSTVRRLSN